MRAFLLATASAAAVISGAGAALAQSAGAQGATANAGTPENASGLIGEVIVTAQKRTENVQNVAATVTAVSSATLQRAGVNDIRDIQKLTPEVQVQPGAFTNIGIRGIRTGSYGPTTESPSAVHIDGVYLSRFTAFNGLFFDVQRVEVLAGPQGTLYGRNSASGTINVITNKPTDHFGGRASIEYGNYNTLIANGAINLPITDTLATRLAVFRSYHRGYADNGTDDNDLTSARFSALWRPTAKDSILFTADIEEQGGKGAAPAAIVNVLKSPTVYTCPGNSIPIAQCAAAPNVPRPAGFVTFVPAGTPGGVVVPIQANPGPRQLRGNSGDADRTKQDNQTSGAMAQWDHDLDWATFTAQAAFRDNTLYNTTGATTGFTLQDPRLLTLGAVSRPSAGFLPSYARWFSEEARLTSPSNQPLTWILGAYGYQERQQAYGNPPGSNGSFLVTFPNAAGQYGQAVFSNPPVVNQDIQLTRSTVSAFAAFGQATYSPAALPNLHLTAGGRFNSEGRSGSGFEILNAAISPSTSYNNLHRRDEKFTYKLNASYNVTPDNMIYVDHSTGFRSGSFAYGQQPAIDPETISSYEVGTKNRFAGGRVVLNASAWHYDYKNYVTSITQYYFDVQLGRPNGVIGVTNAGAFKVDGQTVQLDWLVTNNDRLGFNGTHNHTRFTNFDISQQSYTVFAANNGLLAGLTPATYAPYFNYNGTPLGMAAEWTTTATYDHTFDLRRGRLDAQVLMTYRSKYLPGNQVAAADVNNFLWVPAATTWDASLRYDRAESNWSVTAYVRNIANKDVVISRGYSSNASFRAVSDPQTFYAYQTATYGPPRTFGVIFNAEF